MMPSAFWQFHSQIDYSPRTLSRLKLSPTYILITATVFPIISLLDRLLPDLSVTIFQFLGRVIIPAISAFP